MDRIRSHQTARRIALLMALSAFALCGCASHHDTTDVMSEVVSTPLAPDSEMVAARTTTDPSIVRKLVLLKIAQDCLANGFQTFAFTSIGEPKPHLPNRPPNAPPEIAATKTFNPPSSVVPDIQPGTVVTVRFYKAGDPSGTNNIFAQLIVANLAPLFQR
jgi:hypothetical protein